MTATSDSTLETQVNPSPPLTNEKDYEDEVANSRDGMSVAFAQSTAADVSLSLER